MWQVKTQGGSQWRASLESPGSGKLRTFPSLDHLIAFLQAQTDRQRPDDPEGELDKCG
jgi:hypothetical protein